MGERQRGNKFSCDCRISWIAHLANATRNDNFRRELRHIKCDFAVADDATGTSSKVARLSAKELNCPEDHEKPKFENSHHDAKVDSSTMTTVALPDEGDILEHRDDKNHIEEEESEEALVSEARDDATTTTQRMKNEIDKVLSQRKVMQKQACPLTKSQRKLRRLAGRIRSKETEMKSKEVQQVDILGFLFSVRDKPALKMKPWERDLERSKSAPFKARIFPWQIQLKLVIFRSQLSGSASSVERFRSRRNRSVSFGRSPRKSTAARYCACASWAEHVRSGPDLVEHLRTLATTVFVFKVLPRCWVDPQDERRRLVLNRKLAKGVKGMADVVAINPHWNNFTYVFSAVFMNGERKPKRDHFASDGYHVSRFVGIRALS
ncbi:hypothetical protein HPB47_016639 [Ixodes persulcatus]|uniref:Uncharacterized protein n=1 Tax=Ixodes persulcatus TaxID=34615 RepID=A0AC60QQF3_IXOPE|nr:hypothetical protein HPB47_016639 [Ixodes persulcatus]